jgi:hypothetical protein
MVLATHPQAALSASGTRGYRGRADQKQRDSVWAMVAIASQRGAHTAQRAGTTLTPTSTGTPGPSSDYSQPPGRLEAV